MTAVERFARARPRLLRLAYSELGDVGEAEDVVQEAWPLLPAEDGRRAPLSFVVADGRIARIDAVRNPEKLRRL